jgi:hypothetical protein
VLAHVDEQIVGDLPGAIDFVLGFIVGLLRPLSEVVCPLEMHGQLVLERCDATRVDSMRFVIPPIAAPTGHLNTPAS